jgi:hypothetical protein
VRLALLSVVAAVLLAGCGNSRTPAPDIGFIPAPKGFRDLTFPGAGVNLRVPTNWRASDADGSDSSLLTTVAIGDAQIAIWSYPRVEPLPTNRPQLQAARDALVKQVEQRDPTFELTSSRLVIKSGTRAVELIGQGTNHGVRRSVRSLHAYAFNHEVVVDAFAPPPDFPRVDTQTFAPVTRSLRLRAPKTS